MVRRVLGVIVGLIVGFLGILLVEGLTLLVYPAPVGLDLSDVDAMRRHVQSLPAGALLIVLAAHGSGSLAGAFACAGVVRQRWYAGSLIIGILLTAAGLINLLRIPHPVWFSVADVLLYVPLSLLGGWLGLRLFRSRSA